MTYEVHYRGDHAKFAEASRLATIEKRISDLEAKLGKDLKLLVSGGEGTSRRDGRADQSIEF